MISPASIQEVMNRADIVDVVGQFVRLKKRGASYIANCPFHNEKTPSFNVSPAKGIYKCFGCGKAGNVVTFVQDHEKLTYPEAIHWLADYYKITLSETERSPEQQQQQLAAEALRILNEYAATWFHDSLLNSEEGQLIGLSYFKQRGFRKEIIERFRLGYNPEQGEAFYRAASAKGYRGELLERAGLAKNRNTTYYDVYRARVIFPIQSMTGRIVGFGARILKSNEKSPKYINTPENEIYIKSKVLYGMYQSRQAIGKQDECLLVEGYTDVISLHQAGVENVVSSSGTSLTEDQLRLIGQITRNLTILYDGDAAGIKAALRGLDMALGQSFNVQLVLLPDGEDPDSFVQKEGAGKFQGYIKENKQNVISFRLNTGLKEAGSDPVKRSKLTNEIAESISRINKAEDFSLQSYYVHEAAGKLNVDEQGLINLINKYIRDRIEHENKPVRREEVLPRAETISTTAPELAPPGKNDEQEWQLLRILIEYGHLPYDGFASVAAMIEDRVEAALLEQPIVKLLFLEYFEHTRHFGAIPEIHFFINYPEQSIRDKMASLLHPHEGISENWSKLYNIESASDTLMYVVDVDSSLSYFELKKIIVIQEQLTNMLAQETDPLTIGVLLERFIKAKNLEKEILNKHGTVVYKSLKYK